MFTAGDTSFGGQTKRPFQRVSAAEFSTGRPELLAQHQVVVIDAALDLDPEALGPDRQALLLGAYLIALPQPR